MIGVFPIALETNSGVARALLSAEFYGLGMDFIRDYAKIYRAVTLEQANAAAKKYSEAGIGDAGDRGALRGEEVGPGQRAAAIRASIRAGRFTNLALMPS